jgi:hypothetical protein
LLGLLRQQYNAGARPLRRPAVSDKRPPSDTNASSLYGRWHSSGVGGALRGGDVAAVDDGGGCAHDPHPFELARPPEASTESPTLELFGGFLSVLFGAVCVIQGGSSINTGIIWQGGTQHDALRRDLKNILVPRLGRPPEQVTISAARLNGESVDLMGHDFSAPHCAKNECKARR